MVAVCLSANLHLHSTQHRDGQAEDRERQPASGGRAEGSRDAETPAGASEEIQRDPERQRESA